MSPDVSVRAASGPQRQKYWEAKCRLEGLVDGVEVRLDTRLCPYLEVTVADPIERLYVDGVAEEVERIDLERAH